MRMLIAPYFAHNKPELVIETINQLFALDPKFSLTSDEYLLLGRSLALSGDIDAARKVLMSTTPEARDWAEDQQKLM
ncbi:hypothetical protein [Yoonia sp. SS1-5]|uniref:Tetratricopeptide repeat protein n=1 Tax=Yoonia rhodophyticola TaxID=3137370 RepID=A0AAN0NKK5_9RHOB